MSAGRCSIGIALASLVAGLVALFLAAPPAEVAHVALVSRLPKLINGWVGEDLPLGELEVQKATTKLLNYDDYVYRVYRRGQEEIFVYAMFWKQGSVSVREIAGHTPDGCWIANGAKFSAPNVSRGFVIDGRASASGEVRHFTFPDQRRVQVVWWHVWGDDIVDRGFDQKNIVPTLRELWVWLGKRHGVRRDQLLVRIHTTGTLEAALNSEPAVVFLNALPEVFRAKPLNESAGI